MTSDQIRGLLQEANAMPYGPSKVAAVEQAIRHADADGDDELRFMARMLATDSYEHGGEPAKAFVTFSWCLAEFDANPGRFDRSVDGHLRWQFKYVTNALPRFPQLPLARTFAVLDDMERRYRAGGHSLHAVYAQRWSVARHVGDVAAADRWFDRWSAAAPDENSDCAGCDPTGKVWHLRDRGRWEEAVALADPVLGGELTCVEQPKAILTALLLPYLRTGRLDHARVAHLRAYRSMRDDIGDLGGIAEHLDFCTVTGNAARGLEIVRRHVDWLDRAPSPFSAMGFAAAAARVLALAAEAGQGEVPVRRAGADVPVTELARSLAAQARELAARFDARNGTGHQGERIEGVLTAVKLLDLSLSASGAVAGSPGRSASAAAPVVPDGVDPMDLITQVEQSRRAGRGQEAAALFAVFEQRFGAADLDRAVAARLEDERGYRLAGVGDIEAGAKHWSTARELYRAVGDEPRAAQAAGALALAWCLMGRSEEGLAGLTQSAEYLAEHGEPRARAVSRLRLAHAYAVAQRLDESLAELARADVIAGETGVPSVLADVALLRAQLLAQADRLDEAREAALKARDLYRTLGDEDLARASLLLGELAPEGADEERLAAFEEAVQVASGEELVVALVARARAKRALDRAGDAVDDLVEALGLASAAGQLEQAALLRLELADAYFAAGRPLDAAEVAEEALPVLAAADVTPAVDQARYLLVGIYRQLDENDRALALLEVLAERLSGFDQLADAARMREEAGDLLYRVDRDAEAAARFGDAAAAFGAAEDRLGVARALRRRAVSWHWAQQPQRAREALAEADRAAAALPVELADEPPVVWERAMLGYDAARVLVGAGDLAEALERLAAGPDALRGIGAFGEAAATELLIGEVLLRLERPAEAESLLRQLVGGLPRDAAMLPNAAWLLAQAIQAQGRPDEAALLRDEYGLTE
ncbi:hypothetical protein [Pilimelia columellifera]|uniref:Tetratricopeptide repeat protein n=1 Tax=Pilimelia columellifera subsp. columellifera TaxID=706583 RepID=A0ABN3N184_9ACTN